MPPRSSPPPPPPPRSSRPPPKKHRHGPKGGRDLALDAAAIDAALVEIVPDARDRAFVLRCILEEGPRHHRVASWAILRMLSAVLAEVGGVDAGDSRGAATPVGMRLPPNVAASSSDAQFPIGVPTRMLREVLGEGEVDLALESLSDGPPHHALANAAMAWMLEAIYARLRSKSGAKGGP